MNHDSTFLAVAADRVNSRRATPVVRTCCNPLADPRPVYSDDWATDYAAAVTVCALRVKLSDEVADESGLRRRFGEAAGIATSAPAERATAVLNTLGFPARAVWEILGGRDACETPGAGLREAASPTAEAYRTIFEFPASFFGSRDLQRDSLGQLGESMGRMVYWKDALDDREEDLKHGRYNPLGYHRRERMMERIGEEVQKFRTASALVGGAFPLLPSLANASTDYQFAGSRKSKTRKKRSGDRWYERCDCCTCCCDLKACDACCDCGPGDSGCVDCDCCCPCH